MNLKNLLPSLCFQCNRCSSGCPTAHYMDNKPAQIVHLLRMGKTKRVLKSEAIWYCILCETCTARCPQGVDIAQIMTSLKCLAGESGVVPQFRKVLWFNNAFTKNIKINGRLNELMLVFAFKMKTKDFLSDMQLGINMLKHGKLSLLKLPKGSSTVKRLLERSRKAKV